jgi:hypothetical protein
MKPQFVVTHRYTILHKTWQVAGCVCGHICTGVFAMQVPSNFHASEKAGSRYKLSGPDCVVYGCLSRQRHYLSAVDINPFRPSPDRPVTDSVSYIVYRISSGPPLPGAPSRCRRCWIIPAMVLSVAQIIRDCDAATSVSVAADSFVSLQCELLKVISRLRISQK